MIPPARLSARAAQARRDLAVTRIIAQHLTGFPLPHSASVTPASIASSMGALQGQDLSGVMVSLGLRIQALTGCTSLEARQKVVDGFNDGALVRGYPMRGTVFLMAAEHARWMTQLCAAGEERAAAARRPRLGLTPEHLIRARDIAEELCDKPGIRRRELFNAWEAAGIPTADGCGYHLVVHLITTGVLVYGPWNGVDQNVVLAQSWLPARSDLESKFNGDSVAAASHLLGRYVASHGPVTARDAAWWTKLPLKIIRPALAQAEQRGDIEEVDPVLVHSATFPGSPGTHLRQWEQEPVYARPELHENNAEHRSAALQEILLPGFDEVILGYQNRTYVVQPHHHHHLAPGNNGVFRRSALRRAEVVAVWKATGASSTIELTSLHPVSEAQQRRFNQVYQKTWPQAR